MSDENNCGTALSNKSLHCSQSAMLAIVNMINYLQSEVALVDSNAGQLLQMCKAELLQTLAVEATTSALRHGAAQINTNFAPLSQAFASDAARKFAMAQTACDNEIAIERRNEQARNDVALNGVKVRRFDDATPPSSRQSSRPGRVARPCERISEKFGS